MYKYVVQVVFPRSLVARMHYIERTDDKIQVAMHNRTMLTCDDYDANDWMDSGTFFFNHENLATEFAADLAREHPGCDIYVAAVQTIVSAKIETPIVKKVTEKGVLPV